jgi:hypothetical protein
MRQSLESLNIGIYLVGIQFTVLSKNTEPKTLDKAEIRFSSPNFRNSKGKSGIDIKNISESKNRSVGKDNIRIALFRSTMCCGHIYPQIVQVHCPCNSSQRLWLRNMLFIEKTVALIGTKSPLQEWP